MRMSYISSPPRRLHGSIGTILLYFTLVSVQKTKHPFLLNNSVAPEPAGSSPYLQEPTTGPYPEPTVSTPHPQPISLISILIPSSHLRLGLPSCLFPSGFTTKALL
jgi:hypothetical protein